MEQQSAANALDTTGFESLITTAAAAVRSVADDVMDVSVEETKRTGSSKNSVPHLAQVTWDDATWILTSSFIIFTMQSGACSMPFGGNLFMLYKQRRSIS